MSEINFEKALRDYIIGDKSYFSRSIRKQEQRLWEHFNAENDESIKECAKNIANYASESLNKESSLSILEIGSGDGGLCVALALAGNKVVGLEPHESGVLTARLRAKRYKGIDVGFIKGKGEDIPFKADSFDAVVMQSVIEHVSDPSAVINASYRVLRESGVLYIESPNYLWPYEAHYRIFFPPFMPRALGRLYLRLRGKDPSQLAELNYVTHFNIQKALKDAGFKRIVNLSLKEYELKLSNTHKIEHRKRLGILLKVPVISHIIRGMILIVLHLGIYPGFKFTAIK